MSLPASPSPIPVEQFKTLAETIEPVLGAERPAQPGADLGVLSGRAKGRFGDFAWVNPWTPLLRESVCRAFQAAGIPLVGIRAELNFEEQSHEPLMELEALPSVELPRALVPEKCSVCGRLAMKKPENIQVAAESFDGSIPLQRIAELPTVLVANESLAQFIKQRNLRDVIVTAIEVR
jgi:hypothetical protein